MKTVVLLLTILGCAVYATVVTNPFTRMKYVYNSDKYEIIEGDMRVRKNGGRSGLSIRGRLWPNRTLPYKINGTFTARETYIFNQAVASFHQKTCIKIVPATQEHKRFIWINNSGNGCYSGLGYYDRGDQQKMNLGRGCLVRVTTPIHEFLHALGVLHEHSRFDRDEWVKINWDSFDASQKFNFEKLDPRINSDYGVPYNYLSVMHYPLNAFAKENGLNAMETLKPHTGPMGYEIGWADSDVEKLHRMYKCTSKLS